MTNIPFSRGKAIAGEKEDPNDNTGEEDMSETNYDVFQPPHAQSCNSLPAIYQAQQLSHQKPNEKKSKKNQHVKKHGTSYFIGTNGLST